MGTVNLAHALAQWVLAAGIYKQEDYEEAVWKKTKDVMKEFVQYMQNDHITSYATACDNTGWEHPDYQDGHVYVPSNVGHKIICVLMVGALYYMNGWTAQERDRQKEDDINESIRQHLRCIIAHMFSEVLNESVCKSEWGTVYAWTIMDKTGQPGGVSGGFIQNGTCGRELFARLKIRKLELNEHVSKWLKGNSKLQHAIQKIKGHKLCTTPWRKEWNLEDILGNGTIEDTQALKIAPLVHELKTGIHDLLTEIGKQVDQDVQKRQQATKGKSANHGKHGQAANKPAIPDATATPPKEPEADVCSHDGSGSGSGDNHEWTVHCTKLWNT
ncbi:hypothetical protein AK88_05577 [Plasmodium fragile]|uniref:Schizont-infected cell agglutination extracellular alpha domain-containing protein n=1 Tax=Plasmodium fragile TaxID=5857 RepID=A0A0D9QD95_PLAFR|nr:uncharacterized protein AK88_05577 [Plasmodium fragile]KJP84792.1 hypothetical protein AK88_05577 [Plasmodium fragile]